MNLKGPAYCRKKGASEAIPLVFLLAVAAACSGPVAAAVGPE